MHSAYSRVGIAAYQVLRDALAELFGRPVDLAMETPIENPFIRAGIGRARQAIRNGHFVSLPY
jgi:predicted nucleotidyltransferase